MESSSDTSSIENQAFFAMGPLPVDPLPLPKKKTNLILPTRESSRKRTVKSLGPDFVKDFRDSGVMKGTEDFPVKLRMLNGKADFAPSNFKKLSNGKNLRKLPKATKVSKFSGFDMLSGITPGIEVPPAIPLICIVCNRSQLHSSTGLLGTMLKCCGRNCAYTAHAKCMGYTSETTMLVRDRFKCMDCKRCTTCGKGTVSHADMSIILCSKCDSLYHLRCNLPPVDPKSEELRGRMDCHAPNWICYKCKAHDMLKPSIDDSPIIRVILSNIPQRMAVPAKIGGASFKTNGANCSTGVVTGAAKEISKTKNEEPLVLVSVAHEYVDMVRGAVPGPSTYGNLLNGRHNDNDDDDWRFRSVKTLGKEASVGSSELDNIYRASTKVDDKSQEETEEMELVASARKREDFAKWSADKCADYFMMVEPRFASIIRQHNLSGSALILLSWDQIKDLLGLPLGVALKMHRAICTWREASF